LSTDDIKARSHESKCCCREKKRKNDGKRSLRQLFAVPRKFVWKERRRRNFHNASVAAIKKRASIFTINIQMKIETILANVISCETTIVAIVRFVGMQ
jgi:hypothetical protein